MTPGLRAPAWHKAAFGRPFSSLSFIDAKAGKPMLRVVPIEAPSAVRALGFLAGQGVIRLATLPWVHRDPFDRLLVAQAMEDEITLLTVDATLKRYGRFVKLV